MIIHGRPTGGSAGSGPWVSAWPLFDRWQNPFMAWAEVLTPVLPRECLAAGTAGEFNDMAQFTMVDDA